MTAAAASSRAGADPAAAPILRRIPSSGEELPVIGLGTSGPFEVGDSAAERAPLREGPPIGQPLPAADED